METTGVLWDEYRLTASVDARNELVKRYAHLVDHQARRIARKLPASAIVEKDDLVSAGVFGLLDAIRTFDPSRGIKFETFAPLRIAGAMRDSLRDLDWLPRSERQKVSEGKATAVTVKSLNRQVAIGESDIREVGDLLPDGCQQPGEHLERQEVWRSILKPLSKIEKLIVILYYREHLTMSQVGQNLQLSESRVSQLHSRIVERLQRMEGVSIPAKKTRRIRQPTNHPLKQESESVTPRPDTSESEVVSSRPDPVRILEAIGVLARLNEQQISDRIRELETELRILRAVRNVLADGGGDPQTGAPISRGSERQPPIAEQAAEYLRENGAQRPIDLAAALQVKRTSLNAILGTDKRFRRIDRGIYDVVREETS